MKILVTGGLGMLAHALKRRLGETATYVDIEECDLTDREAVEHLITTLKPDVVINTAAYTDVDECEENRDLAMAVNGRAVGYLAESCERIGARLLHISTDYVFDGTQTRPYREEDPPSPASFYGESKLLGEQLAQRCSNHLILRVSWLFGPGKGNFISLMAGFIDRRRLIKVIDDQVNRLTYTLHAAGAALSLIDRTTTGILHYANSGAATRYEQVLWMADLMGASDLIIEPVPSSTFDQKAHRPARSILDTSRFEEITGTTPPPWQEAVREYIGSDAWR